MLDDFSVVLDWPVAWGEMDAFNHVNNVVYFKYFENIRIHYFDQIQLMEWMTEHNTGPILAATDCKYKMPASYPDTLKIGAKITELNDDNFIMLYKVVSEKSQRVTAEGTGKIVYYDYNNNRRMNIPEELRQRMAKLEGWK